MLKLKKETNLYTKNKHPGIHSYSLIAYLINISMYYIQANAYYFSFAIQDSKQTFAFEARMFM